MPVVLLSKWLTDSELTLSSSAESDAATCPMNLPSFEELCKTSDEQLLFKFIDNKQHLLYNLLPAQTVVSPNYHLRKRQHKCTIDNYQSAPADIY